MQRPSPAAIPEEEAGLAGGLRLPGLWLGLGLALLLGEAANGTAMQRGEGGPNHLMEGLRHG